MAHTTTAHKVAEIIRAARGKPSIKDFTSAIILAAGSSTRMGTDKTKQFIELDGIPVVARTVMQFEACSYIHEIIIVAKADEMDMYSDFPEKYSITKPLRVVEGGESRQESARFGSDVVSDKCKFVCIHDAARCLITPDLIERACRGAYIHGNAMLAIKAVDTIKIGDKSAFIESTPERKFAWQAQTPQVFNINAYRAAAYVARDEKIDVTDDASMLEHLKIPVKLCEGSRENIKITDKSDLIYARAILESRKESE